MVAPAMAVGDRVAVNIRPRFFTNDLPVFGRITQVEDTSNPPQILWENGLSFAGTEDAVALDPNAIYRVDDPSDRNDIFTKYGTQVVRASSTPEVIGLFDDVWVQAPYIGATNENQSVFVSLALVGPSGPPRFAIFVVAGGITAGAPVAALPFLDAALSIMSNQEPRY